MPGVDRVLWGPFSFQARNSYPAHREAGHGHSDEESVESSELVCRGLLVIVKCEKWKREQGEKKGAEVERNGEPALHL